MEDKTVEQRDEILNILKGYVTNEAIVLQPHPNRDTLEKIENFEILKNMKFWKLEFRFDIFAFYLTHPARVLYWFAHVNFGAPPSAEAPAAVAKAEETAVVAPPADEAPPLVETPAADANAEVVGSQSGHQRPRYMWHLHHP